MSPAEVLAVVGTDILRAHAAHEAATAAYDGERAGRALATYRGACDLLHELGWSIDAALRAARTNPR